MVKKSDHGYALAEWKMELSFKDIGQYSILKAQLS